MGRTNDLPDGQLELYCTKCSEKQIFVRRPGVPLGSGAARRRCEECGHLR